MARGRMLSQSIALDVEFNRMSMEAQFVFMRTIPHLDRDGLVLGNPVALWAKVAPLLPDLMPKTEGIISEWVKACLVVAYDSPYGAVLYFKGFNKNQPNMRYDRESESLFPPPPGYYRNGNGIEPLPPDSHRKPPQPPMPPSQPPTEVPTQENLPADELRQESGGTPAELRQESGLIEVKLREDKVKAATCAHACEGEPEKPLAAALPDVEKRKTFVRAYEKAWALTLTPYLAEKIDDWCERVPIEAWEFALHECADNRKTGNWKYFESILRRVEVDGLPKVPEPVPKAQAISGQVSINFASV